MSKNLKETSSKSIITQEIVNTLLERRCYFLRKLLGGRGINIKRFENLRNKMIGQEYCKDDYFIIKPEEVDLAKLLLLARKNLNISFSYNELISLSDDRPREYIFIVTKTSEEIVNPLADMTIIERILLELYFVKIRKERFMPGTIFLCTGSKTKEGKSPYLIYNEREKSYYLALSDYHNFFLDKTRNFSTKIIRP